MDYTTKIHVPNIKHAPTSLTDSLEDYRPRLISSDNSIWLRRLERPRSKAAATGSRLMPLFWVEPWTELLPSVEHIRRGRSGVGGHPEGGPVVLSVKSRRADATTVARYIPFHRPRDSKAKTNDFSTNITVVKCVSETVNDDTRRECYVTVGQSG
ncbi:hypothetical protein CJU90_4136 [Yarrowia sp. C11]|nr:hypothetical protein CJU90_4136 [Yarrowia sp. C11]